MKKPVDLCWRVGYRLAYRLLLSWWWLRRPRAEGAGVAVWCEGRLLVVRSSYRDLLDLPGGGIEPGETARSAAIRELLEEAGLAAPAEALSEAARLSFVQEHRRITDTVFEWQAASLYVPSIDNREIVWAGWLTPSELRQHRLAPPLALYLEAAGAGSRVGTP